MPRSRMMPTRAALRKAAGRATIVADEGLVAENAGLTELPVALKGKFDPSSGLYLHPQTVLMMLIWFFVCWLGWIPNIANYAHTGGLVAGMAWGLASSFWAKRRR